MDKARFDVFISPTQSDLKERVKRALLQAGHVSGQSTVTKGAFSRPKISAKVFAKATRLTIYCNDFSWIITVSPYR